MTTRSFRSPYVANSNMDDAELLRETYRVTLENNKMLHKMRRGAFLKGVAQFIIYAALLAAPIWFYISYLAPILDKMTQTVQQIEGVRLGAQEQFSGFQDMWKKLQEKFAPSTSTPQR